MGSVKKQVSPHIDKIYAYMKEVVRLIEQSYDEEGKLKRVLTAADYDYIVECKVDDIYHEVGERKDKD